MIYRLAVVPVAENTLSNVFQAHNEPIQAVPHEYGFTLRNISHIPKSIYDAFISGLDNVLDTHYNVPKQSFPRHITREDWGDNQVANRYPRIEIVDPDTLNNEEPGYGVEISTHKNTGEAYPNRRYSRIQPLIRYTVDKSEKDPYTAGKKAGHKAIAYHVIRNNLDVFPQNTYLDTLDTPETLSKLFRDDVDKYSKHLSKHDIKSIGAKHGLISRPQYLDRLSDLYSTLYANHAINYNNPYPNPTDFHKWMKSQILRDHSVYHPTSNLGTILHLTNNLIRSGKF